MTLLSLAKRLRTIALGFTAAAAMSAALIASAQSANALAATNDPDNGAELFAAWACGGCHTLAAAGASGAIGPALDGNPNLDYDYIINRIANGGGAMPAFTGQLNDDEMSDIAAYILDVAE